MRFVSIFHRRWDHHSEVHKGVEENCRVVDQPIGALLKDLKSRGLLESTLVVWGTEFGRTPVTQNTQPGPRAGRDHHRLAFSVWLAGGGITGGRAVGVTDELGWRVVEDPVHVHDFNATLLHLFGLDHLEADLSLPRPRRPPDQPGGQGGQAAPGMILVARSRVTPDSRSIPGRCMNNLESTRKARGAGLYETSDRR